MSVVPPQRRAWTRGTTLLLIVCVVVAGLAIAAAALLPDHVRDGARREADATLRAFLDEATQGDPAWRDAASPMLHGIPPVATPVIGETRTADALQLTASYTVGDLSFDGSTIERSDTASAVVTLRYRYRILGKSGTASIPQKIWLTRPFYHGSAEPQRADEAKTPTAVGPWRVAGITLPEASDRRARTVTELSSDARNPADDFACETPASALEQIADLARIDAELGSSCFLGAEDGSDVLAEGLDRDALVAAFPAVDASDPASMPAELTRTEGDAMRALRTPFAQYIVADRYVLTFAAVQTENDETATRVVRIEDVGAE